MHTDLLCLQVFRFNRFTGLKSHSNAYIFALQHVSLHQNVLILTFQFLQVLQEYLSVVQIHFSTAETLCAVLS